MVQRGAADSKQFTYGGYSKQGRKMRGGDAIKWLFSRELPLFACTVDRPKAQFRALLDQRNVAGTLSIRSGEG